MTHDPNAELRKAIVDALTPAPPTQAAILPRGINTQGCTPAQLQAGEDAYVNVLMSLKPNEISPDQREDLRLAVARAAKKWQNGGEE